MSGGEIVIINTRSAMAFQIEKISEEDHEKVLAIVKSFWGNETLIVHNELFDARTLDGLKAVEGNQILGICHYHIFDNECEILTLTSLDPRRGIGTALLAKVEKIATSCGCNLLSLTTTNDNLEALGFYQKRGFHLAALFSSQVDLSRQIKPEIPKIGYHGIPIRDELRLEKVLK